MSQALQLPSGITFQQVELGPCLTFTQAGFVTLPPATPPFPLAADPSQEWVLQVVDGVSSWVQMVAPATQRIFALEDGAGRIKLEDGLGYILMEP